MHKPKHEGEGERLFSGRAGTPGCHRKGANAQPPTAQHPLSPAGPGATTQDTPPAAPLQKMGCGRVKISREELQEMRMRMRKGSQGSAW